MGYNNTINVVIPQLNNTAIPTLLPPTISGTYCHTTGPADIPKAAKNPSEPTTFRTTLHLCF